MSRNLYILAATLLLFSILSCGMSLLPAARLPGLPAGGTLWRTIALVLLAGSLASAVAGVMTQMFEQVERRNEERARRERGRRS